MAAPRNAASAADTDIAHEAEVIEAVIRRAGCPVHLVGHSFGGLSAVAVALRGRVRLLSLTIAEAPAPEILHHMGEYRHYLAFRKMSETYFGAYHAGDGAAIERMVDFYGGAGTFAGWPQRVRDYASQTTPVNLMDWSSAYGFDLSPGCWRRSGFRRWCYGARPAIPPPNAPTNCWASTYRTPMPPRSPARRTS